MKKWVDLTRSRVTAFNLRTALGYTESRGKEEEIERPLDSESSLPMEEQELQRQTTEEERDVGAALDDDVDEIERRMSTLSAENAQLKSVIQELHRIGETKSVDEGGKEDIQSPEGYDPLGAQNNKEVQQLRQQLKQLSMQYDELKHINSRLEADRMDAASLKELLKEKENRLQSMEQSNEDLSLQLRSVKEEFQRFRKQSESNAEDYEHRVESLSEQLQYHLKSKQGHSRSLLDAFPENCDHPFPVHHLHMNEDNQSTDVECSVGHDSNADEMEEYHKKIYQLTQSLRSMGMKQKDLQRRLAEAQDERDYLKSVMEDLQQQVDASSPEASARLRAMVQSLETDLSRMERENEILKAKSKLRTTEGEEESETAGSIQQKLSMSEVRGFSFGRKTEDGPSELSEELVDCSMDIMGELANATSDRDIGISMTYVQYAGLLSAVQKAIKHFEQSKQSFESAQSLRVLDSSLSQSLSISRFRVRAPGSVGEKRLDELLMIVKEKESELKFMVNMIGDLRQDIKGHQSLTLQQEVQLEYLKQQLSSSDKVISLTWEVEGLKKVLEESQRELKAQRDLYEQQQQELTIQWQSKQQAVAETLSQNHRVSSFSRQLEHVVEANEALEAERQDLEEALEESRGETAQLNQQYAVAVQELYEQKERLASDLAKEKRLHGGIQFQQMYDLLEMLRDVDASLKFFEHQWSRNIVDKKRSLIQTVRDIDRDCFAWKKEVIQLQEEIDNQREARTKAESLRDRAEQEKIGVQEILSLTSETTSNEIVSLQRQLSGISHELDKEKTERHTAKDKVSELQAVVDKLHKVICEEQQGRQQEVQSLKEKLDNSHQERSNLETRMRSYKDVISGLNKDLAMYEGRIKELTKTIEQHSSSLRLEAEKTETLKEKIADDAKELEDSHRSNAALREQCLHMTDLEATVERLSAEKLELETQLSRSTVDREDVQSKYDLLTDRMHQLELKNAEISRERVRLEERVVRKEEALIEARSEWEAGLVALSEMDIPKDRWPSFILSLVEKWESRALDAVSDEHDRKMKDLEVQLVDVRNQWQAEISQYQEELVECGEDMRSLQETVDNLQLEMKERESKLQSEIKDTKEKMQNTVRRLEKELWEMAEQNEADETENAETIQYLKEQSELKDIQVIYRRACLRNLKWGFQLTDVQAKARELMKEKDEEIDRLKRSSVAENQSRSPGGEIRNDLVPSNVHQLQSEINSLKHQVGRLMDSLAYSERTHELQTDAHRILKEELNALRRSERRDRLDMNYVKNVLVSAFETGSLPKSSPMLIVLARLFEFDEEELTRIEKAESPTEHRRLSSTNSGSMFSPWKRS